MRKPKRWLCIVYLAMLVSTTLFVPVYSSAETCPDGLLLPKNCHCQGMEEWMQVECVLSVQQDYLTVLQTIGSAFSNTTTPIHKITIKQCTKGVELLEPLPKLKLNDIPERSFDGLDQLRQLRLKHNRICLLLPNALNETKTSLELLDLSHNCLVTVPAQNLRNSIGLTHLDLAGNQIGDVAQMQFMNLPKLVELRLNSNRLKGIAPNGFMNVPQLKHFLARDNVLHQLDGQTLQAFKQLEVIDLSANNFVRIPSFKDHSNLVQIHMDSNLIQRIDTLAFSANPKLNLISLQHNVISTISRNSFDSLAALTTLNLANNSLEFIERNMFDGVRNLKNLLIHNNHIMHINNASFTSIVDLVVIDLSGNKLQKIHAGTFSKLPKLFFVDLSNNLISTFERGAFHTRVANIFLDGNQLDCGAEFDWFVTYLVENNVRTFVPNQPEITCASPEPLANVRLKELMMTKANQTQLLLNEHVQSNQPTSFLAGLIPGLVSGGAPRPPVSEVNSVEPAVPSTSVRVAGIPPQMSNNGQQQPSAGDIAQMLKNMPSMVVSIPGFGAIDIAKLPPNVIEHVLRGGQIPGIPADTLAAVVKQYMQQAYYSTAAQSNGPAALSPPNVVSVEHSLVRPLSHTTNNANSVQNLLTASLPVVVNGPPAKSGNLTDLLSPKVLQMMRLLPPNYNLSKLPPLVMKSVMAGEMPDLSLLPLDLQQYLRDNMDSLFSALSATAPNVSIDEILRKLPRFEQPVLGATFSPYDINQIDAMLVVDHKESHHIGATQVSYARLYTAIALGMVGATTLVILGLFCYYLRRNRLNTTTSTTITTGQY